MLNHEEALRRIRAELDKKQPTGAALEAILAILDQTELKEQS